MADYEFRMFIENLQSNVTFLQDAAEDLYDDLDKLDLETKNATDILEILLQFYRMREITEKIFKTIPVLKKFYKKGAMQMKEHKLCPFCGGKEIETYGYIVEYTENEPTLQYCVACYECDATGPSAYTEEEAWEAWDRRVG